MPAEAVWSPTAVGDIDDIWNWIATEHEEPVAADKTINAIIDKMEAAATFPLAAASPDTACRIRSDWRFVEVRGCLAFFRVKDGRMHVDRILSGKSGCLRNLFGTESGADHYR